MAIEKISKVQGRALPLPGENIDTDRIIPARYLKSISFEGLEKGLFVDDRAQVAAQGGDPHPIDDPRFSGATILVVNANFGCGSSREHAPQAIRRHGMRAVIGESFSEIFFGNSLAIGLPCVTAAPEDLEWLQARAEQDPSSSVSLDLTTQTLQAGERRIAVSAPASAIEAFVTGAWDATGLLLEDADAVKGTAARLPYVSGF